MPKRLTTNAEQLDRITRAQGSGMRLTPGQLQSVAFNAPVGWHEVHDVALNWISAGRGEMWVTYVQHNGETYTYGVNRRGDVISC